MNRKLKKTFFHPIPFLAAGVLLFLAVIGQVNWDFWWLISPIWGWWALILLVVLCMNAFFFLASRKEEHPDDFEKRVFEEATRNKSK